MFLILFNLLLILIFYVYYKLVKNHDYWKNRNVPYLKPILLFGNYKDYIFLREFLPKIASDICKMFPNEPYIGTFYGTEPALIVQDPEIIRLILVRDFYYFNGREITDYAHGEVTTTNVFFNGGDEWKVFRQNLTPIFSASKLKKMFPIIKDSVTKLDSYLETEFKMTQTFNVRSLLARYMMECIISVAFGVNANTMKRIDGINPFVIIGDQLFETSRKTHLKIICRAIWPSLFYGLGLKLFSNEVCTFFQNLFKNASYNREKELSKNDFLELIMEWKNNNYITGESISNTTGDKKALKIKITEELLVGQCVMFFAAGFETTSSTLNFLLYELAKNKRVQNKIIEEVDDYLQRHDGDINFECVNELLYIEACIEETLRLYPVLGLLTREVMHEYTLPTGVHLSKGDRIHIPVYHIQRNPDHFPEPEVFRPERFLGEERKKIKKFTFIPFGEGPRICIGQRFSKMPMHAGLITIFKKYRIELAENTPLKLEFKPTGLVTHSNTDIYLKFLRRDE